MSILNVTDLITRVLHKLTEPTFTTDVAALHAGGGTLVVTGASVTAGGSAYTGATVVTFTAAPAGGRTATATAVIVAGVLTSIALTDGGAGYLSTPSVTITDAGGGTGATATATASGDVLTNAQGVVLALNNSKNLRCRQVYALTGTFTRAWLTGEYWCPIDGSGSSAAFAPQTSGSGNNPVTAAGSVLWWPRIVQWTGSAMNAPTIVLTFVDESALRLYDTAYLTTPTADANTAPQFWYRRGGLQGVGVYPVPQGSGTLTVEGFLVPPDMAPTGTVTWCDPSRSELLVCDAAEEIVARNPNDAQLTPRLPAIQRDQAELARNYWLDLPPALRQPSGPFGTPPLAVGAAAAASGAK